MMFHHLSAMLVSPGTWMPSTVPVLWPSCHSARAAPHQAPGGPCAVAPRERAAAAGPGRRTRGLGDGQAQADEGVQERHDRRQHGQPPQAVKVLRGAASALRLEDARRPAGRAARAGSAARAGAHLDLRQDELRPRKRTRQRTDAAGGRAGGRRCGRLQAQGGRGRACSAPNRIIIGQLLIMQGSGSLAPRLGYFRRQSPRWMALPARAMPRQSRRGVRADS